MYEGNLPAGASDDSNAPYNERDLGSAIAMKRVTLCLTNIVEIETYDVVEEEDEDGKWIAPAKDADWVSAYNNCNNPIALLGVLKSMCENKIKDLNEIFKDDPKKCAQMTKFYAEVKAACEGWKMEDIEIDDI